MKVRKKDECMKSDIATATTWPIKMRGREAGLELERSPSDAEDRRHLGGVFVLCMLHSTHRSEGWPMMIRGLGKAAEQLE